MGVPIRKRQMEAQGVTLRQEVSETAEGWRALLTQGALAGEIVRLSDSVEAERARCEVMPERGRVLEALKYFSPCDTRVVILGQDPYPGHGDACGLSFSVPQGHRLPGSLRNIFCELGVEYGRAPRTNGDLTDWARQGVLLLNSVLTVRGGEVASHSGLGWERVTDAVLAAVNAQATHAVFLLWGRVAQRRAALVDTSRHCVLQAAHPSPLAARRGFFGCGHFKAANAYLQAHGRDAVEWYAGE